MSTTSLTFNQTTIFCDATLPYYEYQYSSSYISDVKLYNSIDRNIWNDITSSSTNTITLISNTSALITFSNINIFNYYYRCTFKCQQTFSFSKRGPLINKDTYYDQPGISFQYIIPPSTPSTPAINSLSSTQIIIVSADGNTVSNLSSIRFTLYYGSSLPLTTSSLNKTYTINATSTPISTAFPYTFNISDFNTPTPALTITKGSYYAIAVTYTNSAGSSPMSPLTSPVQYTYYTSTTGSAIAQLYRPLTLITTSKPKTYYQLPSLNSGTMLFFKDYKSTSPINYLNLQASLEGSIRNWSALTFSYANTCLAIVPFGTTNYVISASPPTRDGITIGSYTSNQTGPVIRSQFALLYNSNYQLLSTNYKAGSIIIIKNIYTAAQVSIYTDINFIETGSRGCLIQSGKNYCYIIGRGPSNFFFISVANFTLGTPVTTGTPSITKTPFLGSDCSTVLQFTTSTGSSTGTLIKGINIITSQDSGQKYYNLPALEPQDTGTMIIIKDGRGNASATSPITIVPPAGHTIESTGNSLNLIGPWSAVWFTCINANMITTVAGIEGYGYNGNAILATTAQLNNPKDVALDSLGNIYISDHYNQIIRMIITVAGTYFGISRTINDIGKIYTVAGNALAEGYGGDTGLATNALLARPEGIALDSKGNIYIADTRNSRIRMIIAVEGTYFGISRTTNDIGKIYTVAGKNTNGYSGDGNLATNAQLKYPGEVALDSKGNIYISDTQNNRIRMIIAVEGTYFGISRTTDDIGKIYTVAGGGTSGIGDGGLATDATLQGPASVAFDSAGNMYIADAGNQRIRKVTADIITTIAGTGAQTYSGDGGPATAAALYYPSDVALDSAGNIYIVDNGNNRIRKITNGIITTIAGIGPTGGLGSYSGDLGLATSASLNQPNGFALDSAGNIYIADQTNNRIRKVYNFKNYYLVNYCTTN